MAFASFFDSINVPMGGEMADMLIDQMWEDYDLFYESIPDAKCKGCGTSNVDWACINNKWILLNPNGEPHRCGKYHLPLDVLKEIYKNKKEDIKKRTSELIFNNVLKTRNIENLMVYLSDEQLVNLFSRMNIFVPMTDAYMKNGYQIRLDKIKTEILRRMK